MIERTILDGPRMRFLILAAALAFTASPALGQVRQEILQRAEQGNVSNQTRLGLTYDLDRDVPQNDTEAGRWKPILIGAGIGLTLGFAVGFIATDPTDVPFGSAACLVSSSGLNRPCISREGSFQFGFTVSLVGAGAGAALGWLWPSGEAAPD